MKKKPSVLNRTKTTIISYMKKNKSLLPLKYFLTMNTFPEYSMKFTRLYYYFLKSFFYVK